MRKRIISTLSTLVAILVVAAAAFSQTTAFTYQGSLKDGANPANGNFDFEFKLFDAISAGTQQGSTQQRLNVAVANGAFAVSLDFGAGTLPGANRFLEIAVRTAGGGAFTTLAPRQQVNSAPYSIKSLNSANADVATNATQLGGVAASQYVTTANGGISFIQNTTTQQAANFNINGNGSIGGNLGIGTAAPVGNLHINVPGSGNPISALTVDVGTFGTGTNAVNSSFFKVRDLGLGGTPAFLVRGDGNVGIGAATPAAKLHVSDNGLQMLFGGGNCGPGLFAFGFASTLTCTNYSMLGDGTHTVINRPTGGRIWFRENDVTQAVILPGGNVGIGTTTPSSKLHVSGTGSLRITADSDSIAGFGLRLSNAPKWSLATIFPGQFQIVNDAIGQSAVWIDPANNNVGIGSTSPAATLEVNGYTKLGSDAPSIRVKKLTGTTAAIEGNTVSIDSGLDPSKILSVSVMVNSSANLWFPHSAGNTTNFIWFQSGSFISVMNIFGSSANILSKPIKILITYEQ